MTERKFRPISLDKGYPVVVKRAIDIIKESDEWEKDPSAFGGTQINGEEYSKVIDILQTSRDRVINSGLSTSEGEITEDDLMFARGIVDSMQDINDEAIIDEERRPWNPSVREHVTQVAAYTRVMTEAALENNSHLELDPNRMEVKGLFHDLGRAVTHHPVHHLLAGRKLGKTLGLSADFRRTMLAHGEAGIGPYIVGITPETWPEYREDSEKLDNVISSLPIDEVIIALADIGKKGVQQPDGSYINEIADPVEGLVPSAKRRLKTEKGEPGDQTLMDLASDNPNIVNNALSELQQMGADEENVNKMSMYFGFMAALKRRVQDELGVDFEGPEGMIAKANQMYEEAYKEQNYQLHTII